VARMRSALATAAPTQPFGPEGEEKVAPTQPPPLGEES
jgi:hypothetical protein